MGREYKIKCNLPSGYSPRNVLMKLPSPMKRGSGEETYNYRVEADGFYLIDHLNERTTAAQALQIFIDEALSYSEAIEIIEP
jgi:hypothetical protein